MTVWLTALVWGLSWGLLSGFRIAWYECRARKILAKWDKKGIRFYDTAIWQHLRMITFEPYRTRDGAVICQGCRCKTWLPHCHHIVPISKDRSLAFTPSNLTPLCVTCHDKAHPEIKIK